LLISVSALLSSDKAFPPENPVGEPDGTEVGSQNIFVAQTLSIIFLLPRDTNLGFSLQDNLHQIRFTNFLNKFIL